MAMAIPIIGLALTAVSGVMASNNANDAARAKAAQLNQSAGEVQASSQRAAENELRKSRYIQSRALALTADSGAGASDPTAVNNIAQIAGEGQYRALTSLYEGKSKANALNNEATAAIAGGKAQGTADIVSSVASIARQGSSMYDKYGGGDPAASGDVNQIGYSSSASSAATDYGSSIFGHRYGYG